jgi:hypothetical protein
MNAILDSVIIGLLAAMLDHSPDVIGASASMRNGRATAQSPA